MKNQELLINLPATIHAFQATMETLKKNAHAMEKEDLLINLAADKKALQATMKALEKITHGGARPGAGRKRKDTEPRDKTIAISGTETEIKTIRQKAKASGKTTSRFLIELAMEEK